VWTRVERFAYWEERLAQGEAAEAALRAHLARVGWTVAPGAKSNAYDLLTNDGSRWHMVEVKDESRYASSGNVCLETHQGSPPRPSGISISEASITVHVLGERALVYRTQRMRLALRAWRFPPEPFAGSDNSTRG